MKPIKGTDYHTFSYNDGALDPSEAKNNYIMIFDDVPCEKQDNIRSYFCMGRHKYIDSLFMSSLPTLLLCLFT